jgi:hypothetical protein
MKDFADKDPDDRCSDWEVSQHYASHFLPPEVTDA